MNWLLATLLTISILPVFGQSPTKDFYLKKSIKQEGLQFQFTVLDEDKRGVHNYDEEKFYYWSKAQKVMSTQGGSAGQLLNGKFQAFYENQQLAQKGKFCKGLKDGKWMYWRTDGSLISIEHWNNGRFSGTRELFDEYGVSYEKTKYSAFKVTRVTADSVIVIKRNGEVKTAYAKVSSVKKEKGKRGKKEKSKKEEGSKKSESKEKKNPLDRLKRKKASEKSSKVTSSEKDKKSKKNESN